MLEANQRIGEFLLDERIGKSRFAEVWRAHHHMWADQLAAVKIPTDPDYINNLRRESIRVVRLVHPNIILPLGFDPKAEPPYLITDFLAGGSLRPWITSKKLTVPQTVNVLRQVLAALQFGHQKGMVHGDIRPENILLDARAADSDFSADGCVKVTDFGVGLAAMATLTGAGAKGQNDPGLLDYVAPEQRQGTAPDAKSDIFAVGIMLFEMLTGERPTGADVPSDLNDKVPASLDAAFRRSYARRERRFESAALFLEAIPTDSEPEIAVASDEPSRPTPRGPISTKAPVPWGHSDSGGPMADDDPVIGVKDDGGSGSRARETGDADDRDAARAAALFEPDEQTSTSISDSSISGEGVSESGFALTDTRGDPADSSVDGDSSVFQPVGEDTAAGAAVEGAFSPESGEFIEEAGTEPAEDAPSGPMLPEISAELSLAEPGTLYDEQNNRPIRSADELRTATKELYETRELDQGERANIRLRLVKWAMTVAGGESELWNQITVSTPTSRPFHVLILSIRTDSGEEHQLRRDLRHPLGEQPADQFHTSDYHLVGHFSAARFPDEIADGLTPSVLKMATLKLLREARRQFGEFIVRMDLSIFAASVIALSYRLGEQKRRAYMIGNSLKIVAPDEPFSRIRDDPTKWAATLLDGEQLQIGLKELRRALESSQWHTKAQVMLSAVRGKLAAAYVAEAREHLGSFSWLESLDLSAKAGQLVPGQPDALDHARRVAKKARFMQTLPSYLIAIAFLAMAVVMDLPFPQLDFKSIALKIVMTPMFAAALVTLIAGLWAQAVLGARMSKTDYSFYHFMLFPLVIGGVVPAAFGAQQLNDPIRDSIAGVLVLLVAIADVLLFKYCRSALLRPPGPFEFTGDPVTVLGKVEQMVKEDWDRLRPHYVDGKLGPLYSFTNAAVMRQTAAQEKGELMARPKARAAPVEEEPKRPAISVGDPELAKAIEQTNGRISTAARALAPVARTVATLVGEYSKSVASHQLGMIQSNGAKIEQKGKDLVQKLADFERLCHSPLSLDAADGADVQRAAAALAERNEDQDIRLLRSIGEIAQNFRANESDSFNQLNAMVSDLQAAAERLKKA